MSKEWHTAAMGIFIIQKLRRIRKTNCTSATLYTTKIFM